MLLRRLDRIFKDFHNCKFVFKLITFFAICNSVLYSQTVLEPYRIIAEQGTGKGKLFRPLAMSVDKKGLMYILENELDRIQVFDIDGSVRRTITDEDFRYGSDIVAGDFNIIVVLPRKKSFIQYYGLRLEKKTVRAFPPEIDSVKNAQMRTHWGKYYLLALDLNRVFVLSPAFDVIDAYGFFGRGRESLTEPKDIVLADNSIYIADRSRQQIVQISAELNMETNHPAINPTALCAIFLNNRTVILYSDGSHIYESGCNNDEAVTTQSFQSIVAIRYDNNNKLVSVLDRSAGTLSLFKVRIK